MTSLQKTPQEVRKQASELERKCYDSVSSKKDYLAQCRLVAETLKEQASIADDDDDAASEEDLNSASPETATTIGNYTDACHHQDGLFSFVYKARAPDPSQVQVQDMITGKLVALKVTTPSLTVAPHNSEREARILHACQHRNIIELLDTFWQAGGRFVLVFPFMHYEFGDLLSKGRLTARQIQSHLRDLFAALGYLHDAGVIHRDVKPSNILLKSPTGPAYLADFGISWSPHDKASENSQEKITDVGTTCYRPPELLFGDTSYGCSLDLWAAGCVVAEALSSTHKSLFDAGDLGSELALIQSIFKTLGTPTVQTWPVNSIFTQVIVHD